jgi:hypothetical protein
MTDPDAHAHLIDVKTMFCKKCGQHMEDHAARIDPCPGGGVVVGISHILLRNRFKEETGVAL